MPGSRAFVWYMHVYCSSIHHIHVVFELRLLKKKKGKKPRKKQKSKKARKKARKQERKKQRKKERRKKKKENEQY